MKTNETLLRRRNDVRFYCKTQHKECVTWVASGSLGQEMERGYSREKKNPEAVSIIQGNNVRLSSGVNPGLILHDSLAPQAQGESRGY